MVTTTTDPTREDRCRGFYAPPGLEIQVGETQVLYRLCCKELRAGAL